MTVAALLRQCPRLVAIDVGHQTWSTLDELATTIDAERRARMCLVSVVFNEPFSADRVDRWSLFTTMQRLFPNARSVSRRFDLVLQHSADHRP